jgi:hypothetical protein
MVFRIVCGFHDVTHHTLKCKRTLVLGSNWYALTLNFSVIFEFPAFYVLIVMRALIVACH